MTKYLGITGRMQVGKTTLAEMIRGVAAQHEKDCLILPFAHPVKCLALQMGWNGEKDAKGRRLLQLIGTECGRECIDPDIWVRRWWYYADPSLQPGEPTPIIIADDVRFENEAEKIESLGGTVVRVDRTPPLDGPHSDHASETNEVGFDLRVDNDGTLDDLREHARRIYAAIMEDGK